MKLGIKVGPQQSSIDDLSNCSPDFVEVWFDVSRAPEYESIFTYLKQNQIETGLHYWGVLADNTWTNLAYPDINLNRETISLMQKTIDIAAQNHFVYVNIHPGSRAVISLNLDNFQFRVIKPPKTESIVIDNFLNNVTGLANYARSKNVILTVESVPSRVKNKYWQKSANRDDVINVYELNMDAIIAAAQAGIAVANDFGHTAANCISDNRQSVWKFLYDYTVKLVNQTKLLHLGFIVPPYNGTDFHDSLDNPIFETEKSIPNKTELISLIKLFKNRSDVWALVEPNFTHVKNYLLAQKLLELSGVR
jgi:hypothetical protein